MLNVLISPAGTEIGREIWLSLRFEKSVKIFLAGADYDNHARYVDEQYHILPSIEDSNWLAALQDFIHINDIHFIFPAHDDVLVTYTKYQSEIPAKIVSSSAETCEITRYKSKTYAALADIIPVPRCYNNINDIVDWPVFAKPDKGQGAQGAIKIKDRKALEVCLLDNDGLIISEYLPGNEYTVDCFSSYEDGLLFCQARTRERIRAGISMASITVELAGIKEMAQSICERLQLRGAWFFQVKASVDGTLTLLEVAPRIAGTMAVNRVRGINFPMLSLYEQQNIPVKMSVLPITNRISRALTNSYRCNITFGHVYVDYDDTLVINEKLCLPLIRFLYQCINEGISCYLISRHAGNLNSALKKWRIASLFEKIIHLTHAECKSSYITHPDAIFIDDSFKERQEVQLAKGIYTFDISMLDLLMKD